MQTSWGAASDRGRVRRVNEDALLAQPPVFAVADGMGGHAAGDVASRIAVEELASLAGRASVTVQNLGEALARAADRIRDAVGPAGTAGTTVAGVALVPRDGEPHWLVFNVGDSRVLRLADGVLAQLTVDHSVVQELVDAGALAPHEAGRHPERHVITRAVGTGPTPEPDVWLLPARPADRMLLCSDGLTGEVDDDTIRRHLQHEPDPATAARDLVRAAVEAGGRDNVTVVVVDHLGPAGDAADHHDGPGGS